MFNREDLYKYNVNTALGINGGKRQLPPVLPPRKGSLAAKKCRQQLIIFLQKKYVINQQE